jgi:diguanylate cyclase
MNTIEKPLLIRAEFEAALQGFGGDLLSLAVLDLDHFKEINDSYGHAVGDTVLRSLETILLGSLPEEAAVARLGGDEYAVLLFDQPAESALIVMEEVRRHFSSRTLPEVPYKVQLSVGIACYPTHGAKAGLERAADEALYRAKNEGRGRVAIYVESKMTLKSNYYSKASLERLSKLSDALNRTEASLLREALDDLFVKHGGAL